MNFHSFDGDYRSTALYCVIIQTLSKDELDMDGPSVISQLTNSQDPKQFDTISQILFFRSFYQFFPGIVGIPRREINFFEKQPCSNDGKILPTTN